VQQEPEWTMKRLAPWKNSFLERDLFTNQKNYFEMHQNAQNTPQIF
jgi:hypothetical protein